ncbi:host attachment protein [Hydrogenimonas sp. SS33]|uniref:host attachment protein n=1 Tax=Hydrogenimonas leucolamina TaxID=2954236 RepID=UPI00336C2E04
MKVGDIVIVADLGEMKIYRAEPRDLEAEAGLKPDNVKLDLIDAKDYVEAHWDLKDVVTDEPGRFKGGSQGRGNFTQESAGERHELQKHIEEEIIAAIANDINETVEKNNPPKWFLGLPETIYDRVMAKVKPAVQEKLFNSVRKDLVKTNKNDLVDIFKKKL